MTSSPYKITVPNPCRQAWASMTAVDNGRYCTSCDQTVIDFSILSDDEVKSFFIKNNNNPVCGRFHKKQVDRIRIYVPSFVLKKPIPYWKKFLIIFLICFGSDLYPFDTIIGSHPGLYAQSSTNKNKTGKEKKQGKRSAKKISRPKIDIVEISESTILSGLTVIVPNPAAVPIEKTLFDSFRTSSGIPPSEPTDGNDPRKKSPGQSNPGDNTAYILPARVRYRRRK